MMGCRVFAGSDLPIKVSVKEEAADQELKFENLTGKNVIVSPKSL